MKVSSIPDASVIHFGAIWRCHRTFYSSVFDLVQLYREISGSLANTFSSVLTCVCQLFGAQQVVSCWFLELYFEKREQRLNQNS